MLECSGEDTLKAWEIYITLKLKEERNILCFKLHWQEYRERMKTLSEGKKNYKTFCFVKTELIFLELIFIANNFWHGICLYVKCWLKLITIQNVEKFIFKVNKTAIVLKLV